MDRSSNLEQLTTFDLAFNLATGKYTEEEKFIALDIIRSRDIKGTTAASSSPKPKIKKKPLEGSKAEKILSLHKQGKSPKEIGEILKKKKIIAYPAEIYRVINNYSTE